MAKTRNRKQKNSVSMAIEKFDFNTLLNYATQNRSKKSVFSFQDEFKNLPESDIANIITNLCKMVISCMEKFLAENSSTTDANSCNKAGKLIQVAVDIAIATLQLKFHLQCHVEIAILLNQILPAVPKSQDGVKNSIAQYCEKLCLTKFSDKDECFLFNVFPYLLEKTLGKKVYKADIKRIYAIRSKLEKVMELEETAKDEMWELFKKCALSHNYLSIVEGQKVIALSMVLDKERLNEIHNIIMETLPNINIKFASPYGRVYFEAWCYCVKLGKVETKREIEVTCLHDFIMTALHSGRTPIFTYIRKILAQFHINKKDPEVSRMLNYIYQPILWRYSRHSNAMIRAYAAQLLLDVFPIEDPYMKRAEIDAEINDQMIRIRALLVDDFPIVRITTVIGVCFSMSVNWEVFPKEMIRTYFRIIVNEVSRDSTSSAVRLAVVKGLKCLLENPLSTNCLVSVLPQLKYLFHDTSENVRIAFCQLLLRIKTISAIKYFDVVPVHHLFARLEEDCHLVKKSISNLLVNSYFPLQAGPKIWFGRCLELMREHKLASRVFFSYAGNIIGPDNSVEFIILAIRAVDYYVKNKIGIEAENMDHNGNENLDMAEYLSSLEAAAGFCNLEIISTLFEVLLVLWLSLNLTSKEHSEKFLLKKIVSKTEKPLTNLCLFYKETAAWESVFYISSFLPAASVPCLAGFCFSKLKNLSPNAQPEEYFTLLECLCNQYQEYEMLHLLKNWIVFGLNELYIPTSTKKRRITRASESEDIPSEDEPKPYLANRMLNIMIGNRGMQIAIMRQKQFVQDLLHLLEGIKLKLEQPSMREISQDDASFLSLLVYNIVRISVLRQCGENYGNIEFLDETVMWAEGSLLQLLTFSTEMSDPFNELVFTICQNLAEIVADVVALGYCDSDDDIYLYFFENLLLSEMGYRFALLCTRFLYKHAASGTFLHMKDGNPDMLKHLIMSLCNIFGTFSNESLILCLPPDDNVPFMLGNVMQLVHNNIATLNEPILQAFKCFLQIILDSVITITSGIVKELVDEPFDKISFPVISTFFLRILNLKPKIIPTYIKILTEMFLSSSKDISLWIANWAVIYNILSKKDLTPFILNDANILVHSLGKTLREIYPREKISENITEEPVESPQMLIFQRHCYAEFLKLKSCLRSKVSALKNVKK